MTSNPLTQSILLAFAYLAAGWLGLQIPSVGTHITLVWFPTGIAVAALLRWGWRVWPGIYLGAFLANLSIGSAWPLAAGIAVGNTLAPLLTASLLERAGFHPSFDRERDVAIFISAACVGMMLSAFGGVTNLYIAELMSAESAVSSWLTWWMGDTVGVLLATPVLLSLSRENVKILVRSHREFLLWALVACATIWLAFLHDFDVPGNRLPLAFLTLPLLAWAALRLGNPVTAFAALAFSVAAAWGTATGHGTFHTYQLHISLFLLWSYMATTVLTGLLITALQAERRQAELTLRSSETRLRSIINAAPVPFALNDEKQNVTFLNEPFVHTFGYNLEDIPTLDDWWPKAYPDPAYREWVITTWQARLAHSKEHETEFQPLEVKIVCKDGTTKTVLVSAAPLAGNYTDTHLVVLYDITERIQAEGVIWKQANFDSLTGLPNRAMFRNLMQQEIMKSERTGTQLALCLIDLDQFKEVNDALGHDIGDILLKEAALRISHSMRGSDTVARLGGDEFTVIISDVTETAHLDDIAQKLICELATPFQLGNQTVHVSASIGISLYPIDAANIDSLMKNADQAMYAAKNQGRNRFSYFTPAMQEAAQIRLSLSNDMRLALQRQEFLLHYQPQVSVDSGRVTGLEALVRWQHPVKGLIPPGVFIPIAEDTGLILPLGEWVLRTACFQLKQWRAQGMVDVQMSVNLSARQFRQENLVASISSLLEEIGLPASSLELEITESLAMDNPVENTRTLHNLRNIGVGVAIDDFGTGHSSLGYLKDFPINCLKLDRSFIMHIETEPNDVIIVSAAIELAHDLGMDVVAEGVETNKQAEYLFRLNCDKIQGYYYCRPLPAEEVGRYISERNMTPSHPTSNNIPPMDVLVIDDDEFICTMMASVFDSLGHRIRTVTNPIAGLEMIQQNPGHFGLILVDMLMPNMSGIDLVQAIRKINRNVPIVICTSYRIDAIHKAFKPFEKTCNLLNGINCFILEKPFSGEDVAHLAQKIFHVPAHLTA